MGANARVGFDLDYEVVGGGGMSMSQRQWHGGGARAARFRPGATLETRQSRTASVRAKRYHSGAPPGPTQRSTPQPAASRMVAQDIFDNGATADLVRRARGHDLSARNELIRRLQAPLLARIEVLMGPNARRYAEAKDVVQSVVVDVLHDIDRFVPGRPGSFVRWACQIARNHIHDEVRRKHERAIESLTAESHVAPVDGARPVSIEVSLQEQKELLADALLELKADYREVVQLRYFEGLKFAAIAERMGRSENAVTLLHAKALLALGGHLRALRDELQAGR